VIIFIYKYKLKGIDTPALIISSTYLFKNAISVGIGGELYTLWDYITPIASTIIFAVLLYFVTEMSYIRAAFEQKNIIQY
jgi:hypothetical protein